MLAIFGALLAGLGLFFVGLRLLTDNLKALSGRRLRERVARWTRTPAMAMLWGGVFLLITQSAAAATFIIIGMLRSGIVTVRQALPFIIGLNIAGGIIVLILTVDVKVAVLFLIGISGLTWARARSFRVEHVMGAALGAGLLFFGLATMQEGAGEMASAPWFGDLLAWTHGSYLFGFVIGAGLAFLIQSSMAVAVLSMAFYGAGVITANETLMVVYGANAGSSILTLALSTGLTGQSKQVAMYQVAYNLVGAAIMVPLFFIEIYGGVPLVKAFVNMFSEDHDRHIAYAFIIFNVVPGLLLMLLLPQSARLLARLWPETAAEIASRPVYLHDQAIRDPETAIDLVVLEQGRLIGALSTVLGQLRDGKPDAEIADLRAGTEILASTILETVNDLSEARLSQDGYDRLNAVLTRQHALWAAHETLGSIAGDMAALRVSPQGERFATAIIEGVDSIVLTLDALARDYSQEEADLLLAATSEDGNGLKSLRATYLAEESALDPEQRTRLLAAANHAERMIWVLGEVGRSTIELRADG